MSDRTRGAAGAAGVVALTAAWVVGGLATDGFDPLSQSISQLQRDGAPTGPVLTAAFAAFAGGALLAAPALARRAGRPAGVALAVAGVATLGAALSPLAEVRGGPQDVLHLAFGATGYVALSLLPLLGGLGRGGRERVASYALGAVTTACLLGTVPAEAVSGALQRTGFAAAHLWLLGECWALLRRPGSAAAGS